MNSELGLYVNEMVARIEKAKNARKNCDGGLDVYLRNGEEMEIKKLSIKEAVYKMNKYGMQDSKLSASTCADIMEEAVYVPLLPRKEVLIKIDQQDQVDKMMDEDYDESKMMNTIATKLNMNWKSKRLQKQQQRLKRRSQDSIKLKQ